MIRRTALIVTSLLLFAAGASQAQASTAETSAKSAKVKVSVEIWPKKGAFGYVSSARGTCKAKRVVRVFRKQSGRLVPLGRAKTRKTGRGFIWIVKNRRASSGTVVAKVTGTGHCRHAKVRKSMPVTGGDYPPCPTKEGICHLDQMKIADDDHWYNKGCPPFGSFQGYRGDCKIEVTKGRVPYCCWAAGFVRWYQRSTTRRDFEFWSYDFISQGQPEKRGPDFKGWIENDRSPRFTVDAAHLPPWPEQPGAEWYTPDNPQAAPGTPGGPIYLNWEATTDNHFNFYIGGFLYHR